MRFAYTYPQNRMPGLNGLRIRFVSARKDDPSNKTAVVEKMVVAFFVSLPTRLESLIFHGLTIVAFRNPNLFLFAYCL